MLPRSKHSANAKVRTICGIVIWANEMHSRLLLLFFILPCLLFAFYVIALIAVHSICLYGNGVIIIGYCNRHYRVVMIEMVFDILILVILLPRFLLFTFLFCVCLWLLLLLSLSL